MNICDLPYDSVHPGVIKTISFFLFFFVLPEEIILLKQFFLSLPKRRSYLCIGIPFGDQTAGYIVQITSGLI